MSANYRTLAQIADDVTVIYGDTTAAKKVRAKEAARRHYLVLASAFPWPQLITAENAAITVSGGKKHFYSVERMGRIYGLFPADAFEALDPVGIASYLRKHGEMDALAQSGSMISYTEVGTFGHRTDIDAAEKMLFTPSALDVTAQTTISVTVHGVADGNEVFENLTMSLGATATSVHSYTEVYAFTTDGDQIGTVVITGVSSATVYSNIPPGLRTIKYRKYRVGDAPVGDTAMLVAYKKEPYPLVSDNQVPEIPVSEALYHYALATLYRAMRKPGPIAEKESQLAGQAAQAAFDESTVQGELMRQAAGISRSKYLPGIRGRF